jgi:hypothetical protein
MPLSPQESVVLEGYVNYREPSMMWRNGRLFLTNTRVVFCQSRFDFLNFFRGSFSVLLSDIVDVQPASGFKWPFLITPGLKFALRTEATDSRSVFTGRRSEIDS